MKKLFSLFISAILILSLTSMSYLEKTSVTTKTDYDEPNILYATKYLNIKPYLDKEIDKLSLPESAEEVPEGEYLGNFKLTAYCSCVQCCGKSDGITASGEIATSNRTVAMWDIPFGTKLLINGKTYIVEDRGTPYGHVDIYFDTHEEAIRFGVSYADVYKVA